MLRFILSTWLLAAGTVNALAQNPVAAPSTWKNQRGSILTIQTIAGNGEFQGTFVNKAQNTVCLDDTYLVEGVINADKIHFEVAFADRQDSSKNCLTVTEWRGTVSANTMDTTFSLAYPGPDGLTLIGGCDKFDLQP
jgi:hypothetical protein